LHGTTKINFLALRVSKIQQLTGDDWRRFTRLRDQQLAMLHPSNLAQSAQKGF